MVLGRKFATISSIDPAMEETWAGRTFLTFDLDWAHDEAIYRTIDIVEAAEVSATWFVTHDTQTIERLRGNPKFELGIHPNFLPLLQGSDEKGRNAREVTERILSIVPEAKSVRSHSVVRSTRLLEMFVELGITHECNDFIPLESGMELRPWRDFYGIVRVPYFWADDFYASEYVNVPLEEISARPGLHCFGFHPIHVYINTDKMARYEGARESFQDMERLAVHRNFTNFGVLNFLASLLAE